MDQQWIHHLSDLLVRAGGPPIPSPEQRSVRVSKRPYLTIDIYDRQGMFMRIMYSGQWASICRCIRPFTQAALACDSTPELRLQLAELVRTYLRYRQLLPSPRRTA
jgi:hypothetical protein